MLYIFTKYDENPKTISHIFLEQVLYKACLIADAQKKLKRESSGKPYVDSAVFSISHSKNAIAIAVLSDKDIMDVDFDFADVLMIDTDADVKSIGVDIESIADKKIERLKNIAKAKFFESEQKLLLNTNSDYEYVKGFCTIWTKKESFSKFTSIGMKDALKFDSQKLRSDIKLYTDVISVGGEEYALSLCYNS
ncbi:MAG: 4'-phosphopantetheinyl transferase superfamily protein [Ruminococcus sp.]|nr:4'-phosphopantetheinyl transferase superfamily protein [Ruminococcus sp.]